MSDYAIMLFDSFYGGHLTKKEPDWNCASPLLFGTKVLAKSICKNLIKETGFKDIEVVKVKITKLKKSWR